MNKKLGLRILLQNPVSAVIEGIRAKEQDFFRRKTKAAYGIEKLPTVDLLDLFPNLNETIGNYSYLYGTSLVTDLVLLKSLAKRFDRCAYLEIGSWRGESLVNVSDVTDDCTSITLSEPEMKAMGFSESFIRAHGFFTKHISFIKQIRHNSRTFNFHQLNKKFDLIFIDGDHSYDAVLSDTRKTFSLRKDERSVIVWHDYGFDTEMVRHTTLKAILDGIPAERHSNLYHVSNTMCAVYMENMDLPTYFTSYHSEPTKKFSLTVVAERV